MPLGIVSDEDFEIERSNSDASHVNDSFNESTNQSEPRASNSMGDDSIDGQVITSEILTMHEHGRHKGDLNVPDSLRKIIGETASIEGYSAGKQLASSLGISPSQVSAYSKGNNSSVGYANDDVINHLNGRKTKITKKALNKLSLAISLIDDEKLMGLKARDLSGVAKDMAQVVKHMEPEKREDEKSEPVQFIMYAPQIRNENHYDTVVAKDNY